MPGPAHSLMHHQLRSDQNHDLEYCKKVIFDKITWSKSDLRSDQDHFLPQKIKNKWEFIWKNLGFWFHFLKYNIGNRNFLANFYNFWSECLIFGRKKWSRKWSGISDQDHLKSDLRSDQIMIWKYAQKVICNQIMIWSPITIWSENDLRSNSLSFVYIFKKKNFWCLLEFIWQQPIGSHLFCLPWWVPHQIYLTAAELADLANQNNENALTH